MTKVPFQCNEYGRQRTLCPIFLIFMWICILKSLFKAINACLFPIGVALLLFCSCTHQFRSPDLSVALFLEVCSWVDENCWDSGCYSFHLSVMSDHLFHRLMGWFAPPPPMNPYDLLFSSGSFVCLFLAQYSKRVVLYICNLSFSILFVFLKIVYGLFKNWNFFMYFF